MRFSVLTTEGSAKNVIILLHPTRVVNGRSNNAPAMPPTDPSEPNQETCSSVNGPDASGVLQFQQTTIYSKNE